eukprot:TRINITY_DN7148_c0_g2_i1.p1 TRINITY_DN7148_c0_g2~~TRINITY_DN7148_c0_g2_i1.p1  ORF type:complete len:662 (-),score=127.64 TRINITY_DN7148_c0_g2_i1:168-2153(-)
MRRTFAFAVILSLFAAMRSSAESNDSAIADEYVCADDSHPILSCADGSVATPLPEEESSSVSALNFALIFVLLSLSASFSGLTLGLLSLDPMGLQIVIEGGDPQDAEYAKKIAPIRKKGNFLLCTLLLGNVAVNSLLSILMADLTSGFVGFALSSFLIVCFGEILPQAVCSRHPLKIGAHSTYLVYIFMALTFVMSYPISRLLDILLGEELGTTYTKKELRKLVELHGVDQHGDLNLDEKAILTGALDFGNKVVEQIMVPLNHVFMIDVNRSLSFDCMQEILEKGHSRIPVFESVKTNIVGLLYLSDLALLNPEDETPLRSILQFYGRPVQKVFNDTRLPELLNDFKKGKSHIKIVHRVNCDGPGDPVYEVIGIVTLEDIIEELIQDEIVDESDEYVDVVKKQSAQRGRVDYSRISFLKKISGSSAAISNEQQLAVFSYLRSNVEPFSSRHLSDSVLKKLISQARVVEVLLEGEEGATTKPIYQKGIPDQFFSLIIQGKVEVVSGCEGFLSQVGPFTCLGVNALISTNYVPDFTARPKTTTILLRIGKKQYESAVKATSVQTSNTSRSISVSFQQPDIDPLSDAYIRSPPTTGIADADPLVSSPTTAAFFVPNAQSATLATGAQDITSSTEFVEASRDKSKKKGKRGDKSHLLDSVSSSDL